MKPINFQDRKRRLLTLRVEAQGAVADYQGERIGKLLILDNITGRGSTREAGAIWLKEGFASCGVEEGLFYAAHVSYGRLTLAKHYTQGREARTHKGLVKWLVKQGYVDEP